MITAAGREAWCSLLGILYTRVRGRVDEVADALGLSRGALRALFLIEAGPGIAMGELADRWGCDASYMTSLADDLEARGLVRREPKPTDRRTKLLLLTDRGVEVREHARAMFTEPPEDLAVLDGDEQRQLRDLLAKLGVVGPELLFTPASPRGPRR